MSEAVTNIVEIKNQLNEVVNRRRETIARITTHTETLNKLTTELNVALASQVRDDKAIRLLEVQIGQLQTLLNTLLISNQQHVYDMDAQLTAAQSEQFSALEALITADTKMSSMEGNTLYDVTCSQIELDYIRCKHQALKLLTHKGSSLIIYPTIILVEDSNNSFYIVPTSALQIGFKQQQPDAVAGNIEANALAAISLSIPTMYEETFYMADQKQAADLQTVLTAYLKLLQNLESAPVSGIRREYYQLVTEFGNKFSEFLQKVSSNVAFLSHVKSFKQFSNIIENSSDLQTLALIDLLKCFSTIADISQTSSNESFSIMYLQSKLSGNDITKYEDIVQLNDQQAIAHYKELLQSAAAELRRQSDQGESWFNMAALLLGFDKDLHNEYVSNIYQYASIVIKADGKITRQEEDALRTIMQVSDTQALSKVLLQSKETEKEKTLDELLYDLYDLTGLQTVKQEINTLINLIRVQKARQEFDLANTDMSLHIVFSGNPGTGKTTVARHLAKIYKCLGVLDKGHLVETDRSGMIAEYVGQTAIKVNKLVDSALNGVLFIDEAYAILIDDKDTYGREAIATLLKRMEDDRDKLIVILAGYTAEMQTFIDSNPGLKSRFNKYIFFPDYTPDELYSIFIGMSRKLHFVLEPSLVAKLKERFTAEIARGDASFGNGRYVRNLFEKMIENQANRLVYEKELTKENLTMLKELDLPVNV